MRKVTKRAIQGAVAAALAFGGVAAATGPAAAFGNTANWSWPHDYQIGGNNNTRRCVDDSIDSNAISGNLLRGYPCNGYNWQKWRVIEIEDIGGDTYAALKNDATGLCLDDSNGGPNGADLLRGYPCNGYNWQKWRIVSRITGTNPAYFQQVLQNAGTGRCLDDSDAGRGGSDLLRGYPCNGPSQDGGWQGWDLYMVD
ncbi:RICIN domain-containing protein [Streptomyces mirabilis]|uniref:RICIN domain-containing protein n=1 Tax=Streptomyces mirabilis TaxID=68239 RepID=UPI003692989C